MQPCIACIALPVAICSVSFKTYASCRHRCNVHNIAGHDSLKTLCRPSKSQSVWKIYAVVSHSHIFDAPMKSRRQRDAGARIVSFEVSLEAFGLLLNVKKT